ncbi:hypothetical protein FRC08_006616 [Ceratobasidium sp. 394]|nr:hypothetical protein FRC08_006616 [Ceratobasidium sp. 394]
MTTRNIGEQIAYPDPNDADELLRQLGLDKLPTKEEIHKAIEQEYLTPRTTLPKHWLPTYQIHWKDELVLSDLLTFERLPAPTKLVFERAGLDGRIVGYKEVTVPRDRPTAHSSTSLLRAPGAVADFIRGHSGNVPFKPGGLDEAFDDTKEGEADFVDLDSETLRTIPPGFSRGLKFDGEISEEVVVFSDLPDDEQVPSSSIPVSQQPGQQNRHPIVSGAPVGSDEVDNFLSPADVLGTNPVPRRRAAAPVVKRDWAHVVNVDKPFNNFHELVPDMAHKYPFELDTFQKEAVYHLEMGDSVFVAAHTSAGKTVEREAAGLPPVQRVGARGGAQQRGGGGRGGGPQRGGQRGGPPQRGGGGGAPSRGASHMGSSGPRSHQQQDKNLWVHLVGHLRKKNLLPVVVFTLSKRRCEENAATLSSTDLCDAKERSEVHLVWEKALGRLKGTDKKLPQIGRMRDLLSRGIGVHHGGLLPLVKEVVEILFARGLVKVLFATETFAMGVNMPARSVVFSGIRKHDGKSFRDILPGEYTQMSGRAGRRGLDDTGVVIIVSSDELPDAGTLTRMILGTPGKLQSQFRLTYNMILNLLRVEALKVEEMIKRSFSENTSQLMLPEQQKQVIKVEAALAQLPRIDCDVCLQDIHIYYDLANDLVALNHDILQLAASRTLSFGRVVVLRDGHFPGNLAIFLKNASQATGRAGERTYYVLALVDRETKERGRSGSGAQERPPPRWVKYIDPPRDGGTYEFAEIGLKSVYMVTSKTVTVDMWKIVEQHKISTMEAAAQELMTFARAWSHPETVENGTRGVAEKSSGIEEFAWKVKSLEFQDATKERESRRRRLESMVCVECPDFEEHVSLSSLRCVFA